MAVSDSEFIAAWNKHQSAAKVARELGVTERWAYKKRGKMEAQHGVALNAVSAHSTRLLKRDHSQRADCQIDNGVIMVASDAHYWPGVDSVAHTAFVKTIKRLKPDLVILNGDMFDGSSISRFPASSWGKTPTVKQELDAVADKVDEIAKAAGPAKRWWCLGNHDQRFETRLVNQVPQFEGVSGFSLQERFPAWPMSMSLFVNQNLMIKHRFRGGVHATWNNTLHSGVSTCTGHLHRLQATVMTDYTGTRWGIDTGTLGETHGDHINYGEDNPTNHCSGFAVLTIVDQQLIHPEFCSVLNGRAFFRGKEV